MQTDKKLLTLSILMITVGSGWLLSTIGVSPNIDWVWTLSLAMAGVLVILLSGIDKFSVFLGPILILTSLLSVLRQCGVLKFDVEIPILVIASGLLLLVARLHSIPAPRWFTDS